MEYKEAITILIKLREKEFVSDEEKEALLTAAGALDWASLAVNRAKGFMKAKREKREKNME